jgi:predicted phage-related endonuclease
MLEPIVASEYSLRTGNKLIDINCTLAHKDYPWALANIDRLIVEEITTPDGVVVLKPVGILECKTTSEYNNDEWDEGEILGSYRYQLNWYLGILGLQMGAFACLVGGNKFYYYDVYFDEDLFRCQIEAGKYFWFENVAKLIEPEMQAVDSDLAKALFSDCIKGSEMVMDDDVANDLLATIVDCKKKIKELENIQTEAENRIKDRLKTTEIGYTKDFVVKWTPQSQNRVDTDKLKMVFPDVYDAVKKQINFRKMTIKGGIS